MQGKRTFLCDILAYYVLFIGRIIDVIIIHTTLYIIR